MDYVVGTIHGQGFRLVFRPMDYAPSEADQNAIKARGLEKANRGLALIDKDLAGKDWIVGDFSLADPALFYVSWWAAARLMIGLPVNVQKHFELMMARPSVKKALEDEGLSR
jgi:glutathione S-transferase